MPLTNYAFADLITFTRASTGTFVGSNGLIQTAAINAPRFDFDPVTLAPLGLLIEEQRTNLLLYSQEFDNAVWTKNNGTITANTIASPDGTVDADAFIENTTASAFHYLNQGATKAASSIQYAASFYVKNKGRQIIVTLQSGGSNGVAARIDPATGTVTNAATAFGAGWTAGTITMTAVGGGWYQVVLTATSDTLTSLQLQLALHNGTTNVYTGDGVSGMYLYGAQVEAGAFATSYIPTVAAQVTRSRDAVSMTGTDFSNWYNSNQGTFIASFTVRQSSVVLVANDGTFNNRLPQMAIGSVSGYENFIVAGGAVVANLNPAGTHTFGTTANVSVAYAVNNYAAVANGGTVVTDTSGALPTGINALNIGSFQNGSTPMNGYLRSIIYYPTRLTDAQLQALTL